METISTSETSVNFYQTTRRNIPEDSHLNTRRRKNLKSHLPKNVSNRYAVKGFEVHLKINAEIKVACT
jgi:transposase-like protein